MQSSTHPVPLTITLNGSGWRLSLTDSGFVLHPPRWSAALQAAFGWLSVLGAGLGAALTLAERWWP
jgi:hypothetical protein